ncbi:MAG TPA: hypothetical protein VI455_17400 [Terriglobia bacterium]
MEAFDDKIQRLRAAVSRTLQAEEQEIQRFEEAVRNLRGRHAQLEETIERELAGVGPERDPAAAAALPKPQAPPVTQPSLPANQSAVPFSQPGDDWSRLESRLEPAYQKAAGDFDERVLRDARRFARLLISEIVLYSKAQVDEGRRNRDLYLRLKSTIDRSWQAYDSRFGQSAARRFDFFHEELVPTLASNDPALLGSGYPGPSRETR